MNELTERTYCLRRKGDYFAWMYSGEMMSPVFDSEDHAKIWAENQAPLIEIVTHKLEV